MNVFVIVNSAVAETVVNGLGQHQPETAPVWLIIILFIISGFVVWQVLRPKGNRRISWLTKWRRNRRFEKPLEFVPRGFRMPLK